MLSTRLRIQRCSTRFRDTRRLVNAHVYMYVWIEDDPLKTGRCHACPFQPHPVRPGVNPAPAPYLGVDTGDCREVVLEGTQNAEMVRSV